METAEVRRRDWARRCACEQKHTAGRSCGTSGSTDHEGAPPKPCGHRPAFRAHRKACILGHGAGGPDEWKETCTQRGPEVRDPTRTTADIGYISGSRVWKWGGGYGCARTRQTEIKCSCKQHMALQLRNHAEPHQNEVMKYRGRWKPDGPNTMRDPTCPSCVCGVRCRVARFDQVCQNKNKKHRTCNASFAAQFLSPSQLTPGRRCCKAPQTPIAQQDSIKLGHGLGQTYPRISTTARAPIDVQHQSMRTSMPPHFATHETGCGWAIRAGLGFHGRPKTRRWLRTPLL